MGGLTRYLRLTLSFARYALTTEMSYRANFLVKIFVEMLWLGILLVFYLRLFASANRIAGWGPSEYFFFFGCYYALGGLVETLFLETCTSFPELVRSGDLDFYLLLPIDEQFLVTCRRIDWSTAPNILLGVIIMVVALTTMGNWHFELGRLVLFLVLFLCGCGMAYSFLVLLASASVWLVRNQSLLEMWWLFTTLMRYPRQIYQGKWASPFGWVFSVVIPVLLAVSIPAETMVKALDVPFVIWTVASTLILLIVSRRFFFYALRAYRSASS
jgi:ABC-2 type transport system permease protein